jgi:transposase InsO family protein
VLELGELRAWRWLGRRAAGALDDRTPGGSPMHALLAEEVDQIVALFHQWGETDRSHRKLAHRGSYLNRLWVSPSSVRRVLDAQGLRLRSLPRPGRSVGKPFPDWVDYTPNQIWIYDTTHFTAAGMAVLAIEDLVSRKWLTTVVSVEETSTQVKLAFTEALIVEGLMDAVAARQDALADPTVDDPDRPILLAVSDNGPQMTSGSTREFMALCAIAQHFGRPGTPTDQAWIESLFGHVKAEWPHLLTIHDPATLRNELGIVRHRYNGVRLHAGIGYVTPDDEHEGRGKEIRKAREVGLHEARQRRLAYHREHHRKTRCAATSPVVRPFAVSEMTRSSIPPKRRCRLATTVGVNEASRSRGTLIPTGPTSVNNVLDRRPLRELAPLRPAASCLP